MRSTRSSRRLALCGLTLCLATAAAPAFAQDSVTFNVRIAITTSCTIAAAAPTDIDFGTVASTATAPVLAQGTITAQCSALTPYSIALNAGSNAATAGDVTTRRMRHTDAAVTTNNGLKRKTKPTTITSTPINGHRFTTVCMTVKSLNARSGAITAGCEQSVHSKKRRAVGSVFYF